MYWISLLIVLIVIYYSDLIELLENGHQSYTNLSNRQNDSESLGLRFVVNQPLYVRLFTGSVYMLLQPFPFWTGFQAEKIEPLFMSFNVVLNWFILPLFFLKTFELIKNLKNHFNVEEFFLIFVFIGFTLAVTATSLEIRHLSAFIIPFYIICSLVDLGDRKKLIQYRNSLKLISILILIAHFLWLIMKMRT